MEVTHDFELSEIGSGLKTPLPSKPLCVNATKSLAVLKVGFGEITPTATQRMLA